jgi:hypothetical protein
MAPVAMEGGMSELLAAVGSIGTLGLAVAVTVFAFRYAAVIREQIACRDMLDQEREELRTVRGQLALEEAAHEATQKQLRAERNLRAAVESQRNDAERRCRDYYAEQIRNSGVADAISLVDRLLSMPLPGVVSDGKVPTGDPARTDDDLLAPGV